MKKGKSIFALAITSLFAASVLAGCGAGGQAPTAPAQGGQQSAAPADSSAGKTKLVMATSADFKPFEFHDLSSGKDEITGFDIEIAKYIADKLGVELEVQDMNFDGLIPALQANRADMVMAGLTATEERKKNVDFSDIYYESKNVILSKKDSNLTKVEDLAGKKVTVQTGSIQEGDVKKLQEKMPDLQIVSLNKVPEMIQEVKTGRVDAAVIENTVAKGFVEQNPELGYSLIEEGTMQTAIAFPKGSPYVEKVNEILKEMKDNGEMEKLASKWFQ
ncbi:transporter substrate-binding domain-containing protein [Brevibacillus fulvus]|uniref:Polar amino acid transport system substrate-binding protein n=1 Tax=Brevibacillus fulvus TaxID=1125967 RepID=A0A938Y0N2_9BACL|nr:transporter substrate-binding domain-containing protein [Brevibacillus fulvus]MBM7589407.1 polar amino acid transport system substrate-binding protein [Brevibacillus fulvus]